MITVDLLPALFSLVSFQNLELLPDWVMMVRHLISISSQRDEFHEILLSDGILPILRNSSATMTSLSKNLSISCDHIRFTDHSPPQDLMNVLSLFVNYSSEQYFNISFEIYALLIQIIANANRCSKQSRSSSPAPALPRVPFTATVDPLVLPMILQILVEGWGYDSRLISCCVELLNDFVSESSSMQLQMDASWFSSLNYLLLLSRDELTTESSERSLIDTLRHFLTRIVLITVSDPAPRDHFRLLTESSFLSNLMSEGVRSDVINYLIALTTQAVALAYPVSSADILPDARGVPPVAVTHHHSDSCSCFLLHYLIVDIDLLSYLIAALQLKRRRSKHLFKTKFHDILKTIHLIANANSEYFDLLARMEISKTLKEIIFNSFSSCESFETNKRIREEDVVF
jgi:hypothetical protein